MSEGESEEGEEEDEYEEENEEENEEDSLDDQAAEIVFHFLMTFKWGDYDESLNNPGQRYRDWDTESRVIALLEARAEEGHANAMLALSEQYYRTGAHCHLLWHYLSCAVRTGHEYALQLWVDFQNVCQKQQQRPREHFPELVTAVSVHLPAVLVPLVLDFLV